MSYKVYVPGARSGDLSLWAAPGIVRVVQVVGAAALALGLLAGGLLLGLRRIPWTVRRLGALGFVVAASSIAGFLVSPAAWSGGIWGTRFLAPLIWIAPLALAPAAYLLGTRRFAAVLA